MSAPPRPRLALPFLALVGLAGGALAQGVVHVVDTANGPGTDFVTVFNAVAAASDGDVLLMRSGDYFDLDIDAKSLTVIAEVGAEVNFSSIRIDNIPASGNVVVRDCIVEGGGVIQPSVSVRDCAGPVWIENTDVPGFAFAFFSGGALISNSASVVFTRCDFGAPFNIFGPMMQFNDSTVHLHDVDIQGGIDANGGVDGHTAIQMTDGFLCATGCTIQGGKGSDAIFFQCDGGDGGDGLHLVGTDPEVILLDTTVTAGAGGLGNPNQCGVDGQPGVDMVVDAGTVTSVGGTARKFEVTGLVRDDEDVTLTYTGVDGDLVWFLYANDPGLPIEFAGIDGSRLLATPIVAVSVGAIPPSGTLVQTIPLSPIGVDTIEFAAQAAFFDITAGRFFFASTSHLTVLDAAF